MADLERKFLLPGEFHATKKPMLLATLLGSCVSVCLHNRNNGFAAMNHYLLPSSDSREQLSRDPGRYGATSCARIIDSLMSVDANPPHYTAQIFGGGEVTGHGRATQGDSVGKRNIQMAEDVLASYRIRINRRETGGPDGRKIYFDTASNTVEVKMIGQTEEEKRLRATRQDLASRKLRLLIVDDSPTVRKLLRKGIEGVFDMEVVAEAENPYEARDQLLTHDPDVILLDIIMPRMNGIDFLKKLSQHFPKPVVIVSTIAKAGSEMALKAAQYGAMEVVDKEKLELYKGIDVVKAELIPKIRSAMRKFAGRK